MAKIIVDAFGGDNAPLEVIKGCERAVKELGVKIILTGDEKKIRKCAGDNGLSLDSIEIAHTPEVFDIHEKPEKIMKEGKNTSMALGMKLLADEKGDAFVSAGSTGALVMGATFMVKRIKGIKRIAPAPILPADKGNFILLDAGANTECRADMLVQFAVMGSAYMEKVMGVSAPKVGLLNIGAEETKGRPVDVEANELLRNSGLNFTGNIEARELPKGVCDVVVTDGFTGNIVLKLYEGMGSFFAKKMKWIFSGAGVMGALFSLKKIKMLKKQMDYRETGGSVLLGVKKPVIKAHGSSDAKAFFNAVVQAQKCVDGRIIESIENYVKALSLSKKEQVNE